MPAFQPARQPLPPSAHWLLQSNAVAALRQIHSELASELSDVFGDVGIMIVPQPALTDLSVPSKLARLIRLNRINHCLEGELRCTDLALPFAPGSLSLTYVLCGLESSPAPEAFLDGLIRLLRPQGKLVLVTLNPASLLRARGVGTGGQLLSGRRLVNELHSQGMQVTRRAFIGPLWSIKSTASLPENHRLPFASRLRLARLIIAERREPGMTALRLKTSPIHKLRTDVAPGLNRKSLRGSEALAPHL